jgi:hypothetical protein
MHLSEWGLSLTSSSSTATTASSSASASTGGSAAGKFAAGSGTGSGSNARSGPAAGGSVGTASSVTASGFTLTTSAGVVDRVVELGDGDYEVHYIGVNWPHHIFVNSSFQVIGANS